MRITIAERFKPYMHLAGSSVMLPHSIFSFKIFPASISVFDLEGQSKELFNQIPLNINGPLKGFTIQQDLEKGCIRVWGTSLQGYFRYRIQAAQLGKSFTIAIEKEAEGTSIFSNPQTSDNNHPPLLSLENLSFGISKSQDWQMVHRRQKMMEIIPFWYRLGQLIPPASTISSIPNTGTLHLLTQADEALKEKNPEKLIQILEMLYLSGFKDLLVPRLEDDLNLGYNLPSLNPTCYISPLALLYEGKNLIKRMLIDTVDHQVNILPCLPAKFHCGRMINVKLDDIGLLDLEWSKKTIRRINFQPHANDKLTFRFPKNVTNFRLRRLSDGLTHFITCGQPIQFSSTDHYLFDNFK